MKWVRPESTLSLIHDDFFCRLNFKTCNQVRLGLYLYTAYLRNRKKKGGGHL